MKHNSDDYKRTGGTAVREFPGGQFRAFVYLRDGWVYDDEVDRIEVGETGNRVIVKDGVTRRSFDDLPKEYQPVEQLNDDLSLNLETFDFEDEPTGIWKQPEPLPPTPPAGEHTFVPSPCPPMLGVPQDLEAERAFEEALAARPVNAAPVVAPTLQSTPASPPAPSEVTIRVRTDQPGTRRRGISPWAAACAILLIVVLGLFVRTYLKVHGGVSASAPRPANAAPVVAPTLQSTPASPPAPSTASTHTADRPPSPPDPEIKKARKHRRRHHRPRQENCTEYMVPLKEPPPAPLVAADNDPQFDKNL